ncbi:hypothetical protein B0H67DRAFT_551134 [Lasiosphaeris hirsuta]|uniref:Uncharacterized protein n=1 Tax=Lasiosphaeris hirsuta TaxID=260670 RepID=A0AA40E5B5_9PEZI|nr:hypothetical protein B0H67DRAFT_551134 [Lasiosphaeris hirsuta]
MSVTNALYLLLWDNTAPIDTLLATTFPKQTTPRLNYEINTRLSLKYLKSYHGFRINFTDNLTKHLDLYHTIGWYNWPAERDLDLRRYKYWGARLARLSSVITKGPSGVRQLKPRRWPVVIRNFFNFWVTIMALAILTIGFGTASVWLTAIQYDLGKQ